MSNSGWVKIHRKLREWRWYHDTNMVRLFLHLLIEANYDESQWGDVVIKRGQLVFGRDALAKELGMGVQTIRTCMDKLKAGGEITIKATNKFSILTIVKYEEYQHPDGNPNQQDNQPKTSNQPATNQQLTTSKEVKEIKNKDTTTTSARESENLSVEVIKVFDDAIAEIYGDEQRRAWPTALDATFAQQFLAAGATADWLKVFFREKIGYRKKSGQPPPTCLAWLKDAVPDALAKQESAKNYTPKGRTNGKHTDFGKQNYRNADGFDVI